LAVAGIGNSGALRRLKPTYYFIAAIIPVQAVGT
jgi:hypothetical protein